MGRLKSLKDLSKKAIAKKLALGAVATLAILLPTLLAIASARYTDKSSADKSFTVILSDIDGNELFREDETSDYFGEASLIGIFKAIQSNMVKTDKPPSSTVTEAPLTAKLIASASVSELTCYFSFTQGGSYCVDTNGQYYRIQAEDSERFLCSEFAEALYTAAVPPTLTTGDGDTVIPQSVAWSYKNVSSVYLSALLPRTASDTLTYNAIGNIALYFSTAPDDCTVSVYQDEEEIFEGVVDELPSLILESSKLLTITVDAVWEHTAQRDFYGKLSYRFYTMVYNRAEFSISSDTLVQDGFIILSADQIADRSKLSFSDTEASLDAVFTFIGKKAYAVIPYPSDISGDVYTFSVAYGVSAQTFSVRLIRNGTVSDRPSPSETASALGVPLSNAGGGSDGNSFILSGNPSAPSNGFSVGASFGDSIQYNGQSHSAFFNEYVYAGGGDASVTSLIAGQVCFTGENERLGRYVIIDIGLGLRLWYCGLSTSDLSAGDIIAVGEHMGNTGALLSGANGYYVMLTYYDTLLDASSIIK